MVKALIKKLTPNIVLDCYHRMLACTGALLYRFPSRQLKIIGITGTKGKTSTVYFITRILEHAGYAVGVVSGLHFKIGKHEEPNDKKMTMPGRFFIQRQLRRMVEAGCTHAVLEVTSEGIAQHRHEWIDFDTAAFTNIAMEHIESHGSFEQYLAAKQQLFKRLSATARKKCMKGKRTDVEKTIVVNGDDAHADDFVSFPADKKYCTHLKKHGAEEELAVCAHVVAEHVETQSDKTRFNISQTPFVVHPPGLFNAANATAAVAVGLSEGLSLASMAEAVDSVKVLPGRMEYIWAGQQFDVVVDYAHTPDSLDAVYRTVYETLRERENPPAKIIGVVGAAGGGRDTWKRGLLGAIAGMWSSTVIVTNEDPYDEDPLSIIDTVADGVQNAQRVYRGYFGDGILRDKPHRERCALRKIGNRREAIREALREARKGDAVVITGKGSERVMAVSKGRKIPWDDRQVTREELAKLGMA